MTEEDNKIIENYLLDTLSEEEKAVVDDRISKDNGFRESLYLQKNIFESLDQSHLGTSKDFSQDGIAAYQKLLSDEKTQELKAALQAANSSYKNIDKPTHIKWIRYVAAAAVILLLAFNFLMPTEHISSQELYMTNFDLSELPSLVVRGNEVSKGEEAQLLFENGDYDNALLLFSELSNSTTSNKAILLEYKGVSEMKLGNYKSAKVTFDQLTQGDYLDASKGLWYNAMLALKQDDTSNAQKYLEKIVNDSDNYKYKQAKKLLEQL